jgi:phenolic acid decarboxylase
MDTERIHQFVPVGVLEGAFSTDNLLLPHVDDLAGKQLILYFDNGWTIEHRFLDNKRLDWLVTAGQGSGDASCERYIATNPRLGIYFVDFVRTKERAVSVSLVLDTIRNIFTAVIGELPTRQDVDLSCLDRVAKSQELTSVKTTFLHGSIGTSLKPDTLLHDETPELIGKRIAYTYNNHEQYEHMYMNENFYAWHCLQGKERGLSDVDRCHYFKVGHMFYLFVWRDKIIPALGVELIDLRNLRTTGKIFGYQGDDFGRLSNFPVCASARIVSGL